MPVHKVQISFLGIIIKMGGSNKRNVKASAPLPTPNAEPR